MKFSVLMSLYIKANLEEVAVSLKSIYDEQTLKPDEIVIVKDGPLQPSLDQFLQAQSKVLPISFVCLKKNGGLGEALRQGVLACKNEIIARMDGDDISLPNRFAIQIAYMEKHPEIDILGGVIAEFSHDPSQTQGYRVVPLNIKEIKRFLQFRNPFNHVTVCFRKSAILENGNYKALPGYEDYWLWARCLAHGAQGANLPDVLVNVRTSGMISRRKGIKVLKADFKLSKELYILKIITLPGMIRNIFFRIIILSIPTSLLERVYQLFLRSSEVPYYNSSPANDMQVFSGK